MDHRKQWEQPTGGVPGSIDKERIPIRTQRRPRVRSFSYHRRFKAAGTCRKTRRRLHRYLRRRDHGNPGARFRVSVLFLLGCYTGMRLRMRFSHPLASTLRKRQRKAKAVYASAGASRVSLMVPFSSLRRRCEDASKRLRRFL